MGSKPKRVTQGSLVLMCEVCGKPVVSAKGFLTVRERKFLIYHDDCAEQENVVCGVFGGASGNRLCKINVSLIATADLLLATLAGLALEIKTVDWVQLIQKVVWDTEYYFDPDGLDSGKKTAKQVMAENLEIYESVGFNANSGIGSIR